MTPKISVIIPIYNTEKYLSKCLESVLNQTLQEIEVICVDDCSPDQSYLIVQEFIKRDSRVSIIRHEENKGQGGARNTAILAAKAEFIASVDSDDSMRPEMLQTLWDACENGKYDVVCCNYDRIDEDGVKGITRRFPAKSIQNYNNDVNIFLVMNPSFWNKLWRKSLYIENNILFPEKIYYQDLATIPRILTKSKNIKVIDSRLYLYLTRSGSVTTSYSSKHILDYFTVFEVLLDFLVKNNLIDRYREEFVQAVDSNVSYHANNVLKSNMTKDKLDQYLRHLLMLKVSFLENCDFLMDAASKDLVGLMKSAHTHTDVVAFRESKSSDQNIRIDLITQKKLSRIQRMGGKLFGFVFHAFIKPRQFNKLKMDPEAFFRDSRSKITRSVGRALKII